MGWLPLYQHFPAVSVQGETQVIMGESTVETIPVTVEFSGGLELLFSKQKTHKVQIPANGPSGNPANIGFLVGWLCDNLMKDKRKDMFVMDGTVRNGILVLINDADWELEGEDEYVLEKNDNILFVSTLHGG